MCHGDEEFDTFDGFNKFYCCIYCGSWLKTRSLLNLCGYKRHEYAIFFYVVLWWCFSCENINFRDSVINTSLLHMVVWRSLMNPINQLKAILTKMFALWQSINFNAKYKLLIVDISLHLSMALIPSICKNYAAHEWHFIILLHTWFIKMAMIILLIDAQKNKAKIENQRLRDEFDPFLIPTDRLVKFDS